MSKLTKINQAFLEVTDESVLLKLAAMFLVLVLLFIAIILLMLLGVTIGFWAMLILITLICSVSIIIAIRNELKNNKEYYAKY